MHTAIICIGSNVHPRSHRIADSLSRLAEYADIKAVSEVRESDDITGRSAAYLNQAVFCSTALAREDFESQLARIEQLGGRRHGAEVSIDLDLVIWDESIVSPEDYNRDYFKPLFSQLRLPQGSFPLLR